MSENRSEPTPGQADREAPQPTVVRRQASVADGSEHALDPREITVARITGAIASAVWGLMCLIGCVVLLFVNIPPTPKALAIPGIVVLFLAYAAVALLWPAVRHRYISYRIDESGIRIRRGVWWRTESSVPRSRVQHTDVSRGPLERAFGLATLVIYTAGTEYSRVSLSGLAEEVANPIRDWLVAADEDHGT